MAKKEDRDLYPVSGDDRDQYLISGSDQESHSIARDDQDPKGRSRWEKATNAFTFLKQKIATTPICETL